MNPGNAPLTTAAAIAEAVLAAPARLGDVRMLAIDGPTGAGKSTVAATVADDLRARGLSVALVCTDEFATWGEPVSWWPRLVEGVLEPLRAGRQGRYQRMDWAGGEPQLGDWVTVARAQVLIVEGVSAGRASVRSLLSGLCWVAGPGMAARLERAVARDGEASRVSLSQWQAFEQGWFEVDRTPQHATIRG